eukprot:SAG11_NODE_2982_length_2793_cov_3.225687_1_plen_609_part_00
MAIDPDLRPVASFAILGLLLISGHVVRAKVKIFRIIFLPASCIGGALGCGLLQLLHRWPHVDAFAHRELIDGWTELPPLLTNIVFVAMVLGEPLPSLSEVWRISAPQLAFAQVLAFGQYLTCGLLSFFVLGPVFKTDKLFSVLVPLGFEGGHGVVAGSRKALAELGYPQGYDIAMVAATVGLLLGTAIGVTLVNFAARRKMLANSLAEGSGSSSDSEGNIEVNGEVECGDGRDGGADGDGRTEPLLAAVTSSAALGDANGDDGSAAAPPRRRSSSVHARVAFDSEAASRVLWRQALQRTASSARVHEARQGAGWNGVYAPADRPVLGHQTVSVSSLDSLALHLAVVGVVLVLAWGLKVGLGGLAPQLDSSADRLLGVVHGGLHIVASLPLFLFGLLAAIVVQACFDYAGPRTVILLDRPTMSSLCATSMDFLVVAAIATMDFAEFATGGTAGAFMLAVGATTAWCVLAFVALHRQLPDYAAERAITEVGLTLGATATALLVLRMMDPQAKTPVLRAFCAICFGVPRETPCQIARGALPVHFGRTLHAPLACPPRMPPLPVGGTNSHPKVRLGPCRLQAGPYAPAVPQATSRSCTSPSWAAGSLRRRRH